MNLGQTVFSQLMEHLPRYEFQKCVTRYRGDYQHKGFSCWNQFLAMGFAQFTYRESLRDIEACIQRSFGTALLPCGGQEHGRTLGSDGDSIVVYGGLGLSRCSASGQLCRCGDGKVTQVSDQ